MLVCAAFPGLPAADLLWKWHEEIVASEFIHEAYFIEVLAISETEVKYRKVDSRRFAHP